MVSFSHMILRKRRSETATLIAPLDISVFSLRYGNG